MSWERKRARLLLFKKKNTTTGVGKKIIIASQEGGEKHRIHLNGRPKTTRENGFRGERERGGCSVAGGSLTGLDKSSPIGDGGNVMGPLQRQSNKEVTIREKTQQIQSEKRVVVKKAWDQGGRGRARSEG